MALPLRGGIPTGLDLGAGYIFQFTALAAVDGSLVSGVTVSGATLTIHNVTDGDLDNVLEQVDPLFIPVPITDSGN